MFRSIPPITRALLIANIGCYVLSWLAQDQGIDLAAIFGLRYFQSDAFAVWQMLTYMFMHASLAHIFFNMFALWMFGRIIEQTLGSQRYLTYYMVCGIGAAVCQEVSQFVQVYAELLPPGAGLDAMLHLSAADRMVLNNFSLTVGASGAVYGLLLAFGLLYPQERLFVFPLPVPLKAKWFVMIYVAIELFSALGNAHGGGDGVAHVAHLGGMLFGFLLIKLWQGRTPGRYGEWDGYEVTDSHSATILGRIRHWMHLDRDNSSDSGDSYNRRSQYRRQADWDDNARQRQHEAEVDRILDKVRRTGYASLTPEEKATLFQK